ncbi:MAG TPA: sensor domain-containing diguanylate cyclase [Anaeromyxobacter sp.]|nr:sensor domain-containing diguanylate cyclase [Anaeromyxobacter sp.]
MRPSRPGSGSRPSAPASIAGARARRFSLSSPQTLRDLVLNLREGVYITNADGAILDANPALLALFGLRSVAELSHRRVQEWIDPEQRRAEHVILERNGVVRDFEFRFRRPDGEPRTVIDTAFMRRDATGKPVYYGILIDITERKELERKLLELGQRDPLTGCFNRRFLSRFEAASGEHGWSCIIVDVDDFKSYNDTHGHDHGDRVLVRMGRLLSSVCRSEDAVVRLGGDEFAILLSGVRGRSIDRVVRRLARAARAGSPVPFSMGWATRWKRERLERTMARADRRLIGVRVALRRDLRGPPRG